MMNDAKWPFDTKQKFSAWCQRATWHCWKIHSYVQALVQSHVMWQGALFSTIPFYCILLILQLC